MKKLFPTLIVVAILLVGCYSNVYRDTAYNNPLEPIRLSADTEVVDMRVYVPKLAQKGIERDSEHVFISDRIGVIDYSNDKDTFSLVVLPNKAHKQSLVSAIESEEEENQVAVRIRFVEPIANEHIVAFVQNIRVPDSHIQKQEDDTWLIKIEPRLRGRSVLRIYAEDDTSLFNDLFIPLYMGHPMQSGKFYSHLDEQAKVYTVEGMDTLKLQQAQESMLPFDGKMSELNDFILNEIRVYGAHNTRLHAVKDTTIWEHALALTLPGVPCIYEKETFPEDGLYRLQWQMLKKMRNQSMPLMYGEYIPLRVDDNVLEFERVYLGNKVRVKLDRRDKSFHVDQ